MLDLGPFRLLHPAGRGATATVWRAVHRARELPVAVKVITALDPADAESRRRLHHEVREVARLDHPAIIRVHDHGDIPPLLAAPGLPAGAPYLVMDWHDGGTLDPRRGRMSYAEVRATLLTLLDALAHAHARGVVHRDLKPANVLLGAAGPVLTDFGLVFTDDTPTHDAAVASGTPNYMAPEQVEGDWRSFGPWTDLYALGCFAWSLLTGSAPFAGRGVREVMSSHLAAPLPPLAAAVPPAFEAWLTRLLHKSPARRYRFAADAAVALLALPDALQSPARETAAPAPDDPTLHTPPVFVAIDELAWTAGPRDDGRPPLPADWRRPDPPWAAHLPGCGRALAELRELRLRGREAERDRLWALLAEVTAGAGVRVAVIDGPSGIGKTRLMRWIARRAHALGQADAVEIGHVARPGPGDALLSLFTRRLRLHGLDPAAAGARIRRALAVEAPLAAAIAALDRPDRTAAVEGWRITLSGEREIATTLADGLAALAAPRPLIVQIDDAHWGERALRLVHQLQDERPELPLLFVLTARPALADRPRRRLLDTLLARPGVAHLPLAPLDPTSHDESAAARLPLAPATRDRLTRLTGGNPLFSTSLLRHWLHTDALVEAPDGYRLTPDAAAPPTLPALLALRLDAVLGPLAATAAPALELAATLGVVLDEREWLAACVEAAIPRPDDAVERLLDAGLLVAVDDRLAFAHALLAEALLDRARAAGRDRRWHAACAAALHAHAAARARRPIRQATHLAAAGRPAAAWPCWRAAIEAAENAWGAITDADAWLLGAAMRAGRNMGLRPTLPAWVELVISWSAHQNFRRRGLGLRHARHALARARRGPDRALEARALRQLARCLADAGALADAEARLADAEALSEALGDTGSLCASRRLRAGLALRRGALDAAEALLDDVLARLAAPGAPPGAGTRFQQVEAHNQLGEIARRRGDLDAAARHYAEALHRLGDDDTWLPALIALNLALVDLAHDDVAEAERRARRARTRLIRAGAARYRIYAEAVLLACAGERGDAALWDRAWDGLGPVTTLDFVYLDVARLLDRAARAAAATLPDRAARAAALARRQYDALGHPPDGADGAH
ncbi:MAG: serine/threonine-protein kinase PknK [Myxococcales bacterium]|nr:serine/threonine-protein kinase PknK [Myxococcales bacterium]